MSAQISDSSGERPFSNDTIKRFAQWLHGQYGKLQLTHIRFIRVILFVVREGVVVAISEPIFTHKD